MEIILKAEPEAITLDTARTALIVVDMQNAFCKRGGLFDYMGRLNEDKARRIIEVNKKIVGISRDSGMRIVFLRMTYSQDLSDAGGQESPNYWKQSGLALMRKNPELRGKFLTRGTWDQEIVDELKPETDDIVVDKTRYSGFVKTDLDAILKTNNIKYTVFTGLFTNVCVESTLRDAFFHEYFPILISDGCGNTGPEYTQEATVWTVASVFGWVTSSDNLTKSLKIS
ncbi:MAG TPA: isochorismatase family protein [Dehalococcoidia bacterium]|nr:isochorismatase family protein [Dehalococcoidia bacterium]